MDPRVLRRLGPQLSAVHRQQSQLHRPLLRNFRQWRRRYPRPSEQASLLTLLQLQGMEDHHLEKELRIPAAQTSQESAGDKDNEKSTEKSDAAAKPKEEKKPTETVIPAGSYVVRMDQPYSR